MAAAAQSTDVVVEEEKMMKTPLLEASSSTHVCTYIHCASTPSTTPKANQHENRIGP